MEFRPLCIPRVTNVHFQDVRANGSANRYVIVATATSAEIATRMLIEGKRSFKSSCSFAKHQVRINFGGSLSPLQDRREKYLAKFTTERITRSLRKIRVLEVIPYRFKGEITRHVFTSSPL